MCQTGRREHLELPNAGEDTDEGLVPFDLPIGEQLVRTLRRCEPCIGTMLLQKLMSACPNFPIVDHGPRLAHAEFDSH